VEEVPMSSAKENGATQAFPLLPDPENYRTATEPGLTKREHFAAMAMQGILSNLDLGKLPLDEIADMAADHADFLLLALAEQGGRDE
jgi:hypothetical protein